MKTVKRFVIIFSFIAMIFTGCGAIPTYPVPATLDVGRVIAETAAVEMTKIAAANALPATDVVVDEPANEEIATPEPVQVQIVQTTQRPKDIALLLGTLSMDAGSEVYTGEKFQVTWRLRNIGESVWDDSYSLVYIGGEAFGQDPSIPLSIRVAPGDIIDLTLVLTAPALTGNYLGEWLLVAPDGQSFGVGYEDPQPLVVDIMVTHNTMKINDHQLRLFVVDYSAGEWRDQYGPTFVNAEGNIGNRGLVTRESDPLFEGDIEENEPTLIMRPAQGEGGFIEGRFTPFRVTSGNYFTTHVGCMAEGRFCDTSLKIYIQSVGEDTPELYWEGGQINDGQWQRIHQPLEKYKDKDIIIIFRVENNGDSTGDIIGWLSPMVLH